MTWRFQIPNHVAIKIALELKKLLIDNSLLDVYDSHFLLFWLLVSLFRLVVVFFLLILFFCSSQSDLEANLFKVCLHNIYAYVILDEK